ncbi:hypothetical protein B0H34DRAFT_673245 [Crassisporium funariophilum]|nr:hypothetical protein B0H34DRAFT_673245 [Crassisporium funariophilum]
MSFSSQPPSLRVISPDSSPERSAEAINDLARSANNVAAGIGEVLQAFVAATSRSTSRPIMVEFGNRTMAIGRQRMASMNGRNAFLYMKSKFGLLNSTIALFLQATLDRNDEQLVEVDLDSWEELVPYIHRLRIIS